MTSLRDRYHTIERWSPVMIRFTVVSLALLGAALVGLVVDDRMITGAPAWLKAAKFGASGAVYLFALAWMIRDLPDTRLLRVASRLIAWIIVGETVLIAVQAARGTSSHFNIDTALNVAIFSGMGLGIATVWVMSAVLLWLHMRSPAADRAMAIALRLGLVLNILGAGVGWTMTQPRPAQLASMRLGAHPFIAGSHTIGAPDGGAGLPLTRWSTEHGDLRIPHFVGMHALQLLPLLLLSLRSVRVARDDSVDRGIVWMAAAACAALFFAALLQALNGHPLFPPPVT